MTHGDGRAARAVACRLGVARCDRRCIGNRRASPFARQIVAPWIMIDELVYSELAKSFAATGHFVVRDVPTTGYGIVYPVLITPAWRALPGDTGRVRGGARSSTPSLISLTAVPAYVLARRLVSARGALVVAVLTVAVPSGFYAGTIMTENAFYPIFVTVALALVVALERTTIVTLALFLASLLVAYETRAQAVAFVPAALTAPIVAAALARRVEEVRSRWRLFAVLGGAALAVVGGELARGRSLDALLGAYAAATHGSYDAGTVLHWLQWHLGEFDFYVGFVPVFALVVLCSLGSTLTRIELTIVSATIAVVAWFAVEVAAFASQPSVHRIEERNLFYVAPLLFTCLVLWLERGRPVAASRSRGGGRGHARALPSPCRTTGSSNTSATSDTFGVLVLWSTAEWLHVSAGDIRRLVGAAALAAVCLAVAAHFSPPARRGAPAWSPRALRPRHPACERAHAACVDRRALPGHHPLRPRLDHRRGRLGRPDRRLRARTGRRYRRTVNENEFFNRAVRVVYTLIGSARGPCANPSSARPRRRDLPRGRRIVNVHDPPELDTSVPVAGTRVAADARKGLVLLRIDGPLRAP